MLNVPQRGHSIRFHVGEHIEGDVRITLASGGGFEYAAYVNENRIPDTTEVPPPPPLGVVDEVVEGSSITISVPTTERDKDPATGELVTFYRVDTMGETKGSSKHKRFSQFHTLDAALRARFAGSSVWVPKPPEKGSKFLQNHLDPKFVAARRVAVERYMRTLAANPRIAASQVFRQFVGLSSDEGAAGGAGGTHEAGMAAVSASLPAGGVGEEPPWEEVDVKFDEGPLGLRLAEGKVCGEPAYVAAFTEMPDGGPGQAEKSGKLHIGDILARVNGEVVLSLGYIDALGYVRGSSRPMTLTFLTPPGHDGDAEAPTRTPLRVAPVASKGQRASSIAAEDEAAMSYGRGDDSEDNSDDGEAGGFIGRS